MCIPVLPSYYQDVSTNCELHPALSTCVGHTFPTVNAANVKRVEVENHPVLLHRYAYSAYCNHAHTAYTVTNTGFLLHNDHLRSIALQVGKVIVA